MSNLYILIPAYNEAERIGPVIEQAKRFGSVVVVDDGSSDGTDLVARRKGASVLRHRTNAGKGAALRTGFRWLRARGPEWVVTLDADGQHNPEEIQDLLDVAHSTGADVVVGSRMPDTHSMPFSRWVGNAMSSAVMNRFSSMKCDDVNCGFRLIRGEVLRDVLVRLTGFEAEACWLIDAARAGYRIVNGPISTIYNDKVSHFRGVRDTLRFIQTCFLMVVPNDWYWLTLPKRRQPGVVEEVASADSPTSSARAGTESEI